MGEREQVNIKIKPAKKERWKDYQSGNPEYSSLTDLIRQSVEKEIAASSRGEPNPNVSQADQEIAELKDMVISLEENIDSLNQTVDEIKLRTGKPSPAEEYLRTEIFAALPSQEALEEEPKTPEEIAEEIDPDVEPHVVAEIVDDLESKYGIIRKRIPETPDGADRYEKAE